MICLRYNTEQQSESKRSFNVGSQVITLESGKNFIEEHALVALQRLETFNQLVADDVIVFESDEDEEVLDLPDELAIEELEDDTELVDESVDEQLAELLDESDLDD